MHYRTLLVAALGLLLAGCNEEQPAGKITSRASVMPAVVRPTDAPAAPRLIPARRTVSVAPVLVGEAPRSLPPPGQTEMLDAAAASPPADIQQPTAVDAPPAAAAAGSDEIPQSAMLAPVSNSPGVVSSATTTPTIPGTGSAPLYGENTRRHYEQQAAQQVIRTIEKAEREQLAFQQARQAQRDKLEQIEAELAALKLERLRRENDPFNQSGNSGGDYVKGHYRNGKYVSGYYRSRSNGTVTDNYSYSGNRNPYTGAVGRNKYRDNPTSGYYGGR